MSTLAPDSVRLATFLGALQVGPAVLAEGSASGPLAGVDIVVKDLIDIAGVPTSAGNPDYLHDHAVPLRHATAVQRMLDAGARVVGKSHTDELAFSLSGTNVHYGTPVNPRDPTRVPGGSSSGSASAVAGGLVRLALATDTGGSIRVPASYCGVFGFRPTHGRVPLDGVVEFAPSFGTVGALACDGALLEAGGLALISGTPARQPPQSITLAEDLFALADTEVAAALRDAVDRIAPNHRMPVHAGDLSRGRLPTWFAAFRGRQMVEAWASHGSWISSRTPDIGPGIAARFAQAAQTPLSAGEDAAAAHREVRDAIDSLLPPGGVLALPSAASVAPPITLAGPTKDDLRTRTMHLTCVAGLGRLPALSLPVAAVDGLPAGLCLVGRLGDDERLLALARTITTEELR